jgi:uncharacterized membrane protein YkvA (DUF1232 family)
MSHGSERMKRWKTLAISLKREIQALFLAYKDPRVPWPAKIVALLVVAYALSPIDLIPDCIPVLGYLDDLVILPLGILLVLKMIPAEVMQECRSKVGEAAMPVKGASAVMGVVIVVILWLVLLAALVVFARQLMA